MNKTLYILAEDFSNDTRESFFEKELPYLSEIFKKIYIIPLYPDNTPLNFSKPNIEVLYFDFFQPCNRPKILAKNIFPIIKIFLFEFFKTHNRSFYLKNLKSNLNNLLYKFSAASNFEKLVKNDINSSTVFYSYWFMQWTAALSILKLKYPDLKLVSRVHGADYDESQVKKTMPFRYFQIAKANKIFSVSQFAKNYLQHQFKTVGSKIEVARLGLLLNESLAPVNKLVLHVVSCSSLIPLKRVNLIIEILSNIKQDVHWTHFGSGPLLGEIKKNATKLSTNVLVDLKGHVSNDIFLNYLRNNPVSVFINVSESEGIPVTLMEAISFGIPVIGTNICGVPEIVNETTGFLIPKNFDAKIVAELISEKHNSEKFYLNEFRQTIQNFYKENFYAPINHKKLAQHFVNL